MAPMGYGGHAWSEKVQTFRLVAIGIGIAAQSISVINLEVFIDILTFSFLQYLVKHNGKTPFLTAPLLRKTKSMFRGPV